MAELAKLMCHANLIQVLNLIGFKRHATVKFNCWIKLRTAVARRLKLALHQEFVVTALQMALLSLLEVIWLLIS